MGAPAVTREVKVRLDRAGPGSRAENRVPEARQDPATAKAPREPRSQRAAFLGVLRCAWRLGGARVVRGAGAAVGVGYLLLRPSDQTQDGEVLLRAEVDEPVVAVLGLEAGGVGPPLELRDDLIQARGDRLVTADAGAECTVVVEARQVLLRPVVASMHETCVVQDSRPPYRAHHRDVFQLPVGAERDLRAEEHGNIFVKEVPLHVPPDVVPALLRQAVELVALVDHVVDRLVGAARLVRDAEHPPAAPPLRLAVGRVEAVAGQVDVRGAATHHAPVPVGRGESVEQNRRAPGVLRFPRNMVCLREGEAELDDLVPLGRVGERLEEVVEAAPVSVVAERHRLPERPPDRVLPVRRVLLVREHRPAERAPDLVPSAGADPHELAARLHTVGTVVPPPADGGLGRHIANELLLGHLHYALNARVGLPLHPRELLRHARHAAGDLSPPLLAPAVVYLPPFGPGLRPPGVGTEDRVADLRAGEVGLLVPPLALLELRRLAIDLHDGRHVGPDYERYQDDDSEPGRPDDHACSEASKGFPVSAQTRRPPGGSRPAVHHIRVFYAPP